MSRQSITTKYLGPTDHHGPRVVASCNAERITVAITVAWDHALGTEENHGVAARMLAEQLNWKGDWCAGRHQGLPGYTFVLADVPAFRVK